MIRFAGQVIEVKKLFPKAEKRQRFVKVSQMGIGSSMLISGLGKAVEMLASKLHEIWADGTRAILKAKGAPLEKFKDDGMGGQIDILNTSYADLTPKWKAGVSTGYDFVQNGVTFTQLRFERDLLSWRLDFNWQPFGTNANWSFFIGIKSGVLSDIKYDKRSANNR